MKSIYALMLILFLINNQVTTNTGFGIISARYDRIQQPFYIYNPSRTPLALMVDATNSLAFKVLGYHSLGNQENIGFSPCALTSVLVALFEGCDGQSAYEIYRTMDWPFNRNVIRIGYRDIHRRLRSYFYTGENLLSGLTLNRDSVVIRGDYELVLRFYGYTVDSGIIDNERPNSTESIPKEVEEPKMVEMTQMPFEMSTNMVTTPTSTEGKREPLTSTTQGTVKMSPQGKEEIETFITKTTSRKATVDLDLSKGTTSIDSKSTTISKSTESTTSGTPTELTTGRTPTDSTIIRISMAIEPKTSTTGTPITTQTVVQSTTSASSTATEPRSTTSEVEAKRTTLEMMRKPTTISIESSTNDLKTNPPPTEPKTTKTTMSIIPTTQKLDSTKATTAASKSITSNVPTQFSSATQTMTTKFIENEKSTPAANIAAITTETSLLTNPATEPTILKTDSTNPETEPTTSSALTTIESDPIDEATLPTTTSPPIRAKIMKPVTRIPVSAITRRQPPEATSSKKAKRSFFFDPQYQTEYLYYNYNEPSNQDSSSLKQERKKQSPDENYYLQQTNPNLIPINFDQIPSNDQDEINHIFYSSPNESIQVPYTVYNTILRFAYIDKIQASVLEIPLDSDNYNLLLIIPSESYGLDSLIRMMAQSYAPSLREIRSNLKAQWVNAVIPKFDLGGNVVLTSDLMKLGIVDIFDPSKADFTAMTDERGIYAKHIEQSVTLKIRPEMNGNLKRFTNLFYNPIQLAVNQPFMFCLVDTELELAIMTGRIINPLNSRIM